MIYFAVLDSNNLVTKVLAGCDKDDGLEDYLSSLTNEVYKQTCINTRKGVYYDPMTNLPSEDQSKAFRKNYASVGYYYDSQLDAFIPPKPFPSWILDTQTCWYEPPVPYPLNGDINKYYIWDEENINWVLADLL
jgi:hypothetical protein